MLGELNREVYQIVIKWIIFWSLLQSITFFLVYYTPLESLLWSFCWPDLLLWYLAGVSACVKVVAPRSLCTLPVHAAMRTKICTISGTAMRTRRLLHQGNRAPGLPLQAAHNFKKTDQLCQSLNCQHFLVKVLINKSHTKGSLEKIEIIRSKKWPLWKPLLHDHYHQVIDCILGLTLCLNQAHTGERSEFVGVWYPYLCW